MMPRLVEHRWLVPGVRVFELFEWCRARNPRAAGSRGGRWMSRGCSYDRAELVRYGERRLKGAVWSVVEMTDLDEPARRAKVRALMVPS